MANELDNFIAESGHAGYSWDLVQDKISWIGAWQELFGAAHLSPPANSAELASRVLTNDHHLIFNNTEASFDRSYRLMGPEGELITVREHGTTLFQHGYAIRQQGIIHRTSNDNNNAHPLSGSPDRDPLTGRPNRTCFLALVDKIMNSAEELRNLSAYMVVSVDKLAFMNEAMGSETTDMFLCAIADRLDELCPPRSIIGRVGSDLFGILLPGMSHDLDTLAEKILINFRSKAITVDALALHVAISIGGLSCSKRLDAQAFLILAEQALAEAHEQGGGCYMPYTESPERAQRHRFILETGELVKKALKEDLVKLAFQPVVDSKTNKVIFYEVLSRLNDERGNPVSPADFIPVAEQLGLAPDFDRYILSKVLVELRQCDTLRLAMNISGLTAAMEDWPAYVKSQLSNHTEIAERLIIEITENAAVLDIAKIKCLVDTLGTMGSQVALDDFGAGSTSIRHLRDLSLAIMKIDRDLLSHILSSPEQQHLVKTLTHMAHGLGLRTVAEGIETQEVADWLRAEKVDMLQGF
ncbi:MAG: EAL domain-containing protein, partial [Bdellovibrionales bacterium]